MAAEKTGEVPDGRSFRDFAHLFLSRAPAPIEAPARTPSLAPDPEPPRLPPHRPPRRATRTILFLDGGEGWLRSFLAAELALLLAREAGRVHVAEEGGLFPTISSHLGRVLDRGGRTGLSLERGEPVHPAASSADLLLVEIPAQLPAWSRPWLARADLRILVAGKGPVDRLRAFHQWKRISGSTGAGQTGLVLAEEPGSGEARRAFHRFLAALPQGPGSGPFFLGALPVEPALERVILPERKPAQVFFPGSLTAAALAGLAAAVRRALAPEPLGP